MIRLSCVGLAALFLVTAPAHAAPVSYNVGVCDPGSTTHCVRPNADGSINTDTTSAPSGATPTDKSGTVTTGGVAKTAIALNASRKGWCIQNPSDATEVLQVRSGTAATATTGVNLAPGQQACNPPGLIDTGIISVFAATTAHAYLGTEYQ